MANVNGIARDPPSGSDLRPWRCGHAVEEWRVEDDKAAFLNDPETRILRIGVAGWSGGGENSTES